MDQQTKQKLDNILEEIEKLKKTIENIKESCEEAESTGEVTLNTVNNFFRLVQRSKNIDNYIINILLFSIGALLGFAIAILFFSH
jgi:hypothetical protein